MNNGATNDDIPSLAEAMAEIRRLREEVAIMDANLVDYGDLVHRLRAEIAMLRGTLAQPQPDDEPGVYTFNVPPNAPR